QRNRAERVGQRPGHRRGRVTFLGADFFEVLRRGEVGLVCRLLGRRVQLGCCPVELVFDVDVVVGPAANRVFFLGVDRGVRFGGSVRGFCGLQTLGRERRVDRLVNARSLGGGRRQIQRGGRAHR